MLRSIRPSIILASVICAAPALGQVVDVNVQIDLGGATQIIVPQSRSFTIAPHPWPHPHRPQPRPVEQYGQPIIIEGVEAVVKIVEQTATTTLDISLRNPSPNQTEAILLLPVPDGAAVSAFDFQGSASEPTARLLPREEARRLYDQIVNQVRDPALLEFAGYNLIRSSVFPVPGNGTQKIRLTYDHILTVDGNRVDYALPRSESLDRQSPWRVSLDITAKDPISMVYSPTHAIDTDRVSPTHLRVKTADSARLNPGPFLLNYLLEREGLSASLLAYPDPKIGGGQGGYFLLMAGLPTSQAQAAAKLVREVTIVIDRSGSMAGEKMDQARAAALQVTEGLSDGEYFNIIDYSTAVASFAAQPVRMNDESRRAARQYITNIKPGGGTNIHDSLVEALRPDPTAGTIPIVLYLTDGLPTVGNTSEVAIRDLAEKGNPHHRRIFAFGVGNDVNVPLLDRIADVTRATTTYVLPQEDVEMKVAAVFKRLYGPVMADLALTTHEADGKPSTRAVRDLIPNNLPDLFEGDQLIVLGQYLSADHLRFQLKGNYLGQPKMYDFGFELKGATTKNAFVPRLWAARRIAYLVDQIRQAGAAQPGQPVGSNHAIFNDPRFKELSDEILRLSTEFGILTEYTSFLATEGTNLSNNWERLSATCGEMLNDRAVQTRAGAAAVNQGLNFNDQKGQAQVKYDNRFWNAQQEEVTFNTVQQVCDRAFFKRGDQWIDSQIVAQKKDLAADRTVEYGSPEHLRILHALVSQNRQGVLSLDGDIMIEFEGQNVLVKNTEPNTTAQP